MKEISYISPLHTAFVVSLCVLVSTAITQLAYFLIQLFTASSEFRFDNYFVGMLYMLLMLSAMAFFSSGVGCVVYNYIARKFGGIKIWIN